ncbi:hypothetical protein HA466_0239390 [Hirschfeldia incana]|nr:hypothetical protein HA466_0239390 [Hirschfeldia incana]
MLGSLGDQYTAFSHLMRFAGKLHVSLVMSSSDLSYRFVLFVCHLLKFSGMSKYDITSIGIYLREVSDGGGNAKLKVLGIVLDVLLTLLA